VLDFNLSKYNLNFFLYLFLFFQTTVYAQVKHDDQSCGKSCIVISLPFDQALRQASLARVGTRQDERGCLLQDAVQEEFVVQDVDYTSDIAFEEKEFFYLIGFKRGDRVGYSQLQKAVTCLVKKNKFEKITLSICLPKRQPQSLCSLALLGRQHKNVGDLSSEAFTKTEGGAVSQGKKLHFGLTGFWTFRKIKVSGILVGRYEYSKYYLIEPGDPFDLKKHEHSLEKIKAILKEQGYFQGGLTAKITRDRNTKSVDVELVFNRGPKFSIGDVKFETKPPAPSSCAKVSGDRSSNFLRPFDLQSRQGGPAKARIDTGLEYIENKLYDAFENKFAKKSYSKSLINRETRGLKRYLSKKGFLHVDIELLEKVDYQAKKVNLAFKLILHSKKEFIFFGNSFFTTVQLLDKILVFGRSAWLVPGSILSGEIVQEYHKNGFWDVEVKTKEEKDGYFFLINEGPRSSVQDIELFGANSFKACLLEQKIFLEFLRSKYFEEEKLYKALDKLATFYLKHGFWDIKILKHEFKKNKQDNKSKQNYTLVLTIDEGPRSYLRSVSILGFDELLSQGPFDKFELENNQDVPFDINLLTEQRSWLLKHFKQQGYLHVDVKSKLEKYNQKDSQEDDQQKDKKNDQKDFQKGGKKKLQYVDLQWLVTPGKLVTFGKTVILGSRMFPTDYIMRELHYKVGDVWDNEKLKNSIIRLRSLGIFDHAHLYPYKVSVPESQKDILLRLQHADPYEVRTRVGLARYGINKKNIFGRGFTYKLGGAFLWKNPLNVADTFLFDFDAALDYRNIRVQYCRPWIFGYPIKTIFKIYANRYEQPGFVCSRKYLYEAKQNGFLIGLNRVYPNVDFSFNIGAEWAQTTIKRNMARLAAMVSNAIDFDPHLLGKRIPYLLLEPTILIDMLDNKLNPRSGYFTLVSLKGMFPLKRCYVNSLFIKLLAEQSFFYPFNERLVGGVRFRFGHVFNQCFRCIMPIERFYLGGAHSIRGYEKDMCPPWGIFCDKNRDFQIDTKATTKSGNACVVAPQGGKTMVSINLEARINLYRSIAGVIFQDAGALVGDYFNTAIPSAATGVGLRFNTAIGPIRFDIGWKWKVRRKFESRCAWFLAFGNVF